MALMLLVLAGAVSQAQTTAPAAAASAPAGPTVRAEIAAPLQAARELITNKKGKEALPKLVEAEAMPGVTNYENYVIARLRAVAAVDAGDYPLALAAFERSLASEFLPAADRTALLDGASRLAIELKEYPRAIGLLTRYKDAGGTDPALRRILPQVLAETGDHAGAVRESQLLVAADDAAGRGSAENLLRNLGFSQNKLGDTAGYVATIERLAQQHPKPDYFADLIGRVERKPGFNSERLRLDVYRLQRAVGIELEGAELADMASRALQAGLPGEAQALADEGFAAGVLGKGKDATLHQQLRQQIQKAASQDAKSLADSEKSAQAGKDGNALVNLGFALSGMGQHDKALALTTDGIARGGLRRPDEAQLHLALAQWRAGRKDEALRSFAAVKGSDGAPDLARVWTLFIAGAKR
ncbi:MAG: tetratricopeptide repeat protein [Ideonella sp.]|nr:tetratricopeptide repeat protein [Ideonella sp.]